MSSMSTINPCESILVRGCRQTLRQEARSLHDVPQGLRDIGVGGKELLLCGRRPIV